MRRNFWLSTCLGVVLATVMLVGWHALVLADEAPPTVRELPADTYAGDCSPWTQVNDGAFNVDAGPYSSEEGFEVIVFDGRLYVGMEADNAYGARLWRTRDGVRVPTVQASWEEVAEQNGHPFGNPTTGDSGGTEVYQNDHIDSLAVFEGVLYASTANGGSSRQGTLVYSSATGAADSWTPVITSGFGYTRNTNFKDMQVFAGWLCGGTQNWQTGAQVWCTQDGATWVQKNHGGFGAAGDNPSVVEVWSGHVYSEALYFGVQQAAGSGSYYTDDVAALYRATDLSAPSPTWTQVYSAENAYRLDILGDFKGYLYISHRSPDGIVILRSQSANPGTWTQVNVSGMGAGNSDYVGTVVDGATVYNGALYLAVTRWPAAPATIWRTTGVTQSGDLVDWKQVGGLGFDNGENFTAELIMYNGYLYAWTSNYATGQQVLRTSCPICQARDITGTGEFPFPGVSATLSFTTEALNVVTVCVKPYAFPTAQTSNYPVARTYVITASPPQASFEAALSLGYVMTELVASSADSTTLTLLRWSGQSWVEPCESVSRSAGSVTCYGIESFSTWALGSGSSMLSAVSHVAQTAGSPLFWQLVGWLSLLAICVYQMTSR